MSNMTYIDCHAHLTDPSFKEDLVEVIQNCALQNIFVVAVGMFYTDFQQVVESSQMSSHVAFGLGLHPIQLSGLNNERPLEKTDTIGLTDWLEKYAASAVCLGECGLDFSTWLCPTSVQRNLQREALVEQVELSKKYNLPLNLHSRSAGKPLLDLLKENNVHGALLHAFDGGKKAIRRGVEDGHYFSIAPSIVRDPSQRLVATSVPLDRLVLESDAPALGPVKGKRNTPLNLPLTVDVLAELLNTSSEIISEATTQNALRLFPKLKDVVKL